MHTTIVLHHAFGAGMRRNTDGASNERIAFYPSSMQYAFSALKNNYDFHFLKWDTKKVKDSKIECHHPGLVLDACRRESNSTINYNGYINVINKVQIILTGCSLRLYSNFSHGTSTRV